jgi:hypothetical protein
MWIAWWKEQIPAPLDTHADVIKEWRKGNDMIEKALDLGDQGISLAELPPPAAGPARPVAMETKRKLEAQDTTPKPPQVVLDPAISFRDIVEAWCAEEDLTFLSRRATGQQSRRKVTSTFHSREIDIRREHSSGETCPAHRAMFERVIKALTNMPRKPGIGFRLERARM